MSDSYSHYSQTYENYRRYRPHYPPAVLEWLKADLNLLPHHVVADIGSGTGLLTELFVRPGYQVYAVEPNQDMRLAAEQLLQSFPSFHSLGTTAEQTGLPDQSVDFVTVGNAFHWFNHAQTRPEFARILRPGGWVVLLWNLEVTNGTPFPAAFEQFWQTYIDPAARFLPIKERPLPAYIPNFFSPGPFQQISFENSQVCDFPALKGLVGSNLKAPRPTDPRYPTMLADLQKMFDQHQQEGVVKVAYDTAVIYGQLTP